MRATTALTFFLLLTTACAQANMRGQRRLASQLRLTVAAPSEMTLGAEARLDWTLGNVSERVASGCLTNGPQAVCNLVNFAKRRTLMLTKDVSIVDHPRCAKRFKLEAGQTLSWSQQHPIFDFPTGTASLFCSVQISTSEGCDPLYGCYIERITYRSQVRVLAAAPDMAGQETKNSNIN